MREVPLGLQGYLAHKKQGIGHVLLPSLMYEDTHENNPPRYSILSFTALAHRARCHSAPLGATRSRLQCCTSTKRAPHILARIRTNQLVTARNSPQRVPTYNLAVIQLIAPRNCTQRGAPPHR